MTTTLTSLDSIEEKVGVIIRDLFKADSTLTTLIGRSADTSIHYSYVDKQKSRDNAVNPYIRIDLGDSIEEDYSHDGSVIQANIVLIVNCWAFNPFTAHKMAGRCRTIVNTNATTLQNSHLICRSRSMSSYIEPTNEGKRITHDVVRLFIYAEGDRS